MLLGKVFSTESWLSWVLKFNEDLLQLLSFWNLLQVASSIIKAVILELMTCHITHFIFRTWKEILFLLMKRIVLIGIICTQIEDFTWKFKIVKVVWKNEVNQSSSTFRRVIQKKVETRVIWWKILPNRIIAQRSSSSVYSLRSSNKK